MKNQLLLLISIILFYGCAETVPTEAEVIYSGITETNRNSPIPIGNVDEDDWRYIPHNGSVTSMPVFYSVAPAYPNPTEREATLQITIPKNDSVNIWIDNPMLGTEYKILDKTKMVAGSYDVKIDLLNGDSDSNCENGIARVFIQFLGNDTLSTIHGDIMLER